MNDTEVNTVYTTPPRYGVPQVKISQYRYICLMVLSENLLYEFLNLSAGGRRPRFHQPFTSALPQQMNEEWKKHFANECLTRKWHIKPRKMNQALQLARFFKMQKLVGCRKSTRKCWLLTRLSFPPNTGTHRHENDRLIYTFCGRNDYIMGVIT